MLINFKVANFRSIRDEQALSLVAHGADDGYGVLTHQNYNLLTAAGIFGANAAGKSSIFRALRCMGDFVVESSTKYNVGDQIRGVAPFLLNPRQRDEPSFFEIEFFVASVRHVYGFTATTERVHQEWLHAYPKQKKAKWLERSEQKFKTSGPLDKKQVKDELETVRGNELALSRGAQRNVVELVGIYEWFRNGIRCLDLSKPPLEIERETVAEMVDPEFAAKVIGLLADADTGIIDVSVREESVVEPPSQAKEFLAPKAWRQLQKAVRGQSFHRIDMLHKSEDGESYPFGIHQESNGTRRLLAIAGPVLRALDKGSILIADEISCSLHPLLTQKIVGMFQDPLFNRANGQLVFFTHDTTVMANNLLRRDQCWFVEKDDTGGTELFSLADVKPKPRTSEAFDRNYLAGRYGGVPVFGRTLEDVETP